MTLLTPRDFVVSLVFGIVVSAISLALTYPREPKVEVKMVRQTHDQAEKSGD